jgi:hypothetical protein
LLRVRETGIGMADKEIETALEPFRQLATSTREGSGGTGLGLPLTKALAEANRGVLGQERGGFRHADRDCVSGDAGCWRSDVVVANAKQAVCGRIKLPFRCEITDKRLKPIVIRSSPRP